MTEAHFKNQKELLEKTDKEYAKLNQFSYEVQQSLISNVSFPTLFQPQKIQTHKTNYIANQFQVNMDRKKHLKHLFDLTRKKMEKCEQLRQKKKQMEWDLAIEDRVQKLVDVRLQRKKLAKAQ
jgi:hypothetical protein